MNNEMFPAISIIMIILALFLAALALEALHSKIDALTQRVEQLEQ